MTPSEIPAGLTAAELLEAAIARLDGDQAAPGCTAGRWHLTIDLQDGAVRRLRVAPVEASAEIVLGRRDLDRRDRAA